MVNFTEVLGCETVHFHNVVTANELEFYAFASELVTAEGNTEEKAARLAKNHGFLSSMMKRVYNHFKSFGSKAWRVLKSSRVWYSILMLVVSAIMLVMETKNLRHFKIQPKMGKIWHAGAASLAFVGLCKGFIAVFGKIAQAWSGKEPEPTDKERADALLEKLKEANARTAAYEQYIRAQKSKRRPARGTVHATTEGKLKAELDHEGNVEFTTPSVEFGRLKIKSGSFKSSGKTSARAKIFLKKSNDACTGPTDGAKDSQLKLAKQLAQEPDVLNILTNRLVTYMRKNPSKVQAAKKAGKILGIASVISGGVTLALKSKAARAIVLDNLVSLGLSQKESQALRDFSEVVDQTLVLPPNVFRFRAA